MQRGPELTRFMLEVPRADTIDEWPDERIWAELQQRLHADGEPELARRRQLKESELPPGAR